MHANLTGFVNTLFGYPQIEIQAYTVEEESPKIKICVSGK
jgi:hypothetical protein